MTALETRNTQNRLSFGFCITALTFSVQLAAAPGTDICATPDYLPDLSSCNEVIFVTEVATGLSMSRAQFNDPFYWTEDEDIPDKIGPGDCVRLFNIDGELEIQESGQAGAPIRITGAGSAVITNLYDDDEGFAEASFVQIPGTTEWEVDSALFLPAGWRTQALFEDDVALQKMGDCNIGLAPGQFCTQAGQNPTLYFRYHATDSGPPTSHTLELVSKLASAKQRDIQFDETQGAIVAKDKSHLIIENLTVKKAYRGIWFDGGSDNTVRCVTATLLHNDGVTAWRTTGNIVVEDSVITSSGNGVYFRVDGGEGNVVARNEISDMDLKGWQNTDGHAIGTQGVHQDPGSSANALLIEENDLYDSRQPLAIWANGDPNFNEGEILTITNGVIIRYNRIHDSRQTGDEIKIIDGAGLTLVSALDETIMDVQVYYNEFYRLESGIKADNSFVDSNGNSTLRIYNNTFYDIGTDRSTRVNNAILYGTSNPNKGLDGIIVVNNIFDNGIAGYFHERFIDTNYAGSNNEFRNNLFSEKGPNLFNYPGLMGAKDFHEWVMVVSAGASKAEDPRFFDPGNADFTLKAPLPWAAINAGTDEMLTRDINGTLIPLQFGPLSAIDLGANEWHP